MTRAPNEPEWYQTWFGTKYYDSLYALRDEKEAEFFLQRLTAVLGLRGSERILDVGCGKGRHAQWLIQQGFQVVGIDLIEENIRAAQRRFGHRASFFVHDMRRTFYVNYFDAVFNFFTSFGYSASDRENGWVIRNMAMALTAGGWLVIDFLNPRKVLAELVPEETKHIQGVHYLIRRTVKAGNGVPVLVKNITIDDHGKWLHYQERVKLYEPEHFQTWFAQCRLRLHSLYGDYQMTPFDRDCASRLIFVARKEPS